MLPVDAVGSGYRVREALVQTRSELVMVLSPRELLIAALGVLLLCRLILVRHHPQILLLQRRRQ